MCVCVHFEFLDTHICLSLARSHRDSSCFLSPLFFFKACEFVATRTCDLTAVTCSPCQLRPNRDWILPQSIKNCRCNKNKNHKNWHICIFSLLRTNFYFFFWTVVWTNWSRSSAWFLLAADLLEDKGLEETWCAVKYDVPVFSPSRRSPVVFSGPGLEIIVI